jgi:hypothetical protein
VQRIMSRKACLSHLEREIWPQTVFWEAYWLSVPLSQASKPSRAKGKPSQAVNPSRWRDPQR